MIFQHILLVIQPVIAAYQLHSNSSIQCPDVSFCPFKPPLPTFCLHFIIKSSISIPPALPPFHVFILHLLAGDINPNPGPSDCPKSPMPILDQFTTNILPSQNLFQTMTLISSPCRRLGLDLTPPVPTCLKSPHQVTVCINSHERSAMVEDWGFC